MTREIKFRAWEKTLKEIIPVCSIDFENKQININGAWRFFDEVELMEYTGLKDKNDKEIYEGDIVKWTSLYIEGESIGEVTFFEGCWFIQGDNNNGCLNDCLFIEVIGNIHDKEVTP